MALDGLMFYNSLFFPYVVMAGVMMNKASVCPCISDVVAMHAVVKGDVFYFIERRCTKNWMVLCEF